MIRKLIASMLGALVTRLDRPQIDELERNMREIEEDVRTPYAMPSTSAPVQAMTFGIEWVKPDPNRYGLELQGAEKGWMQTFSGRRFWPLNPNPADVELADLAHGLGHCCRYGGHCRRFYSVAEHCVIVSKYVEQFNGREWAREALLHDSAEAYIGDMIRPLKHQPEMIEFRRAEAAIEAAVFARFGIVSTDESHAAVKFVDDRILLDEIQALMADPPMYKASPLLADKQPLGATIVGFNPMEAEHAFIARYRELFR